ncbi:glutathione-dependent formaldehyde dehydrogenase [Acrocarpospora corrugata]|uniref:Glutathione-dependent formaldehyde dehydrogenase n=1 Tax=Acrocarpospora corrugata TaxID=35763 RepID=A0A5M3W288_9ACTN|nr:zinc-dependent alcohol dehydrogenase [Acrocarpospora corrugata]GES01423.1 glutathione-dependent formaldehyde dehydrogenase [Acrocarpospora corrugata]
MKALTWHGKRDVRIDEVPDPAIKEPNDAIINVTSSGICGSDLHMYEVLGPFMAEGDILGHEAMGIVTDVGSDITNLKPGDRVVIPFNISCGHCFMCGQHLYAQCETTQSPEYGTGAALFGFTKLYGQVPGGQAEYLRVPQAQFGPIKVPAGPADERYLYLSDVLPTAWQAVQYADIPAGGSVTVLGLGPIGQMSCRIARHLGYRVIAVDDLIERLAMARRHGAETVDTIETDNVPAAIRELTNGRGTDAVIDAVGMEAHGSPAAKFAQSLTGLLPDKLAATLMTNAGVDRLAALTMAIDLVRRGGAISIAGLYAGAADPLPMFRMFDKAITLRMGQANVKRWTDALLPLVNDETDPLGVMDLTTHRLPLDQAPHGYEMFQKKQDGAIKILLRP